VLWVSTHLTFNSWLGTASNSAFEVIPKVGCTENITVVGKILFARVNCTSRAAKCDSIRHERLHNTFKHMAVS
jgi:hypothetical protein